MYIKMAHSFRIDILFGSQFANSLSAVIFPVILSVILNTISSEMKLFKNLIAEKLHVIEKTGDFLVNRKTKQC